MDLGRTVGSSPKRKNPVLMKLFVFTVRGNVASLKFLAEEHVPVSPSHNAIENLLAQQTLHTIILLKVLAVNAWIEAATTKSTTTT